MGLLHRRFPRYARPVPFLGLSLAGLFGIFYGLDVHASFSRQTGNFFILLSLPSSILPSDPGQILVAIAGALLGVSAVVWGTVGGARARAAARSDRSAWTRPRFRVYPLTFLFGLFVTYFGIVFLFDASVAADQVRGAFVAFVYLNYAGLPDRPFVTLVGLSLSMLGLWGITKGAFSAGLDLFVPGPKAAPASANSSPATPMIAPPAPKPASLPRIPAESRLVPGAKTRASQPPPRAARPHASPPTSARKPTRAS